MARVTKINVGGTNYDIAHEGELKNSGFEVVTALPTTGLFEGREVMYNGKKYIYSTFRRTWAVAFDEKTAPLYNVMSSRGSYELLGYDYTTYNNNVNRSYLSKYYNYCNITDDYLIEVSTDNETFTEIERANKAYKIFNATNSEFVNVSNYKAVRLTIGQSKRGITVNILSFYINHKYLKVNKVKIDHQLKSDLSWEDFGEFDFTAVNPNNFAVFFSIDMFSKPIGKYGFIDKIRFTIEFDAKTSNAAISNVFLICEGDKYLAGINNYFNLSYKLLDCYSTVDYPITLNYDVANIEPTQTGEVEKKANWVLRYLLQAVNWLKANKVTLSVYNTKVAALEQADSDNNAYTQSVKTDLSAAIEELSNGLATVARSGSYNDLTDKPTFSGSYNDLTDKPTLATVATSGDYNDLLNKPAFSGSYNDLTDKPTLATVATSGSYNDLTDKPTLATVATSGSYDDLLNKPTLVFSNIGGTISSVQIPDGLIANAKLANPSMSLNGITVNLGDTAILPWYVDYNDVDYPARIRDHWLQIYRNGVWANLMYLGDILPTQVGQITSLDNLDWYNEQVSEYEVDSTTTTSILNGTTLPAAALLSCTAEQLTLNLYPISGKQYGKGSLDSLITNLQDKGFSVFVENDLDAIIGSGSDYLVRIKVSKVPTVKAIIECYVAR